MSEIVYIGPVPPMEECAQVGEDDYYERSRKECRVYASQIRRHFAAQGIEFPAGFLRIKSEQHEYGSYREVVCMVESKEEWDLALKVESEGPGEWDAQAREELGLSPSV